MVNASEHVLHVKNMSSKEQLSCLSHLEEHLLLFPKLGPSALVSPSDHSEIVAYVMRKFRDLTNLLKS